MDGPRQRLDPITRGHTHPTARRTKASRLRGAAVLLAIAAVLPCNAANAQRDEIRIQGNWAYTQHGKRSAPQHLATTPAAEGDVWLLLACSRDESLTVSLIHNTQFAFPLKASSSILLRSKNIQAVAVEGRSADTRQIVLDPSLMRHVMPSIVRDEQVVISVPEQAGPVHDYTFAIQPNDIALGAIRTHCLGQ